MYDLIEFRYCVQVLGLVNSLVLSEIDLDCRYKVVSTGGRFH